MSGRLISNDPVRKIREDFHEDGDSIIIQQSQDTTEVEEHNKELYNRNDKRFGKGFQHLVARIPPVVWVDLQRKGIAQDEERLKKWLNDPENRVFKTKPVKV